MILGLLLACADENAGGGYTLTGTVESAGSVADVRNAVAFGVNAGGKAALFVSPNPDATCDDAGTFLGGPGEDWSPAVVNAAGYCNVYVSIPSYEGSIAVEDDMASATVVLGCAMDDGEWVQERHEDDEGYFYDGPWWQGSPEAFSITVEGGDDADFAVELEMHDFSGQFIYDTVNTDPDPGTGTVSGTVTASWCADMGPSLN